MPQKYNEAKESLKITWQMLSHLETQEEKSDKIFVKNHIVIVESMLDTLNDLKSKLAVELEKASD